MSKSKSEKFKERKAQRKAQRHAGLKRAVASFGAKNVVRIGPSYHWPHPWPDLLGAGFLAPLAGVVPVHPAYRDSPRRSNGPR